MNRKDDHVRYAVDQHHAAAGSIDNNDFDSITFLHHALAGLDETDVSLGIEVAGKPWSAPLYINAMTGGSERTGAINRELATAAAETGIAIASGSMSAWLRDPSLADTFRVLRTENPHGVVIANVNANADVDQVRRAVDLIEADAVQIHLNTVQEIVMPEGDRSFGSWPGQIETIIAAAPVPVIVKEVGFGLSRNTIVRLRDAGADVADVAGRGGTNFARIENSRRSGGDYSFIEGWGQSAPACLLDAHDVTGIAIAASGGIRSPLDCARALALGACATGIAGPALTTLVDHGTDALIAMLRTWLDQLRRLMTVLGAAEPANLADCDVLITGDLAQFAAARGIDLSGYARRSLQPRVEEDR